MPNKKSAIKRVRQNERRRLRNRSKRSDMRTSIRNVRLAVEANESGEDLQAKLVVAQSKLARAAKSNIVKKGNASRRISRLAKLVRKAQEASA